MPTIFFIHANGFPGASYAPFFQALGTRGYEVDFIDKIAHNPNYPITNNWPHLVDEVEHILTQRHNEPVIGIGHSAGGLLSYLLARRRPELFSHILLFDPPVINGWQNILWWLSKRLGFSDYFTPGGASKNRRTLFDNREHAYQHLRHKGLFKHFPEESFLAYLEHGLKEQSEDSLTLAFTKEREMALYRTSPDDLYRYKKPLEMPGLYVTAEHSDFSRWPFAERFASQNGMEYQVVNGGHLFPLEQPEGTAEMIQNWLEN